MSTIMFASAHVTHIDRNVTLPAKFSRMIEQMDLQARFDGKRVAIKMHVGSDIGFYTIHPLFVRMVVDAVRAAGGEPFLTDGSFSTDAAVVRGYTPEVVHARVVGAGGEHDRYYYEKPTELAGLPTVQICGNIVDADAMLVLSHGKGHGHTGFGGAIKNIGMGCVSYPTRGAIHALMAHHFAWDAASCTHCEQCVHGCPTGAVRFNAKDEIQINDHHCRYCMHCTRSCPTGALDMPQPEGKFIGFQMGMAAVVQSTLATFTPGSVYYINMLMNITPLCDCWGFSTPPLVPDIGILAGEDIVAIEQASLDLIKAEHLIPGTVPDQFCPIGTDGHLFQRIHGKDPYEQVRQVEAVGLGTSRYELAEIE
ncbi:MAG: DUF362 domain-containing protein [Armatimonadota bacterium]